MPNMRIAFFLCQCLSLDFFFNATVHTTLPLTSSFLISLADQFLCVSRFYFCVFSGAVYVYMYMYMYMCMCMCICVCAVCCVNSEIWKVVRVRQNCWDWKDGERTVRRAKSGETPVEASRDTKPQIVRYTCFMGANDKSNHLTAGSLQRFPRITGA